MVDRVAQFLAARCRGLAIIFVLSATVPLYLLKDARIDNSIEVWIGKKSAEYSRYREFLTKYGNEEFVAIAGEAEDPLSEDCLTLQQNLADRLRQVEEVDNVLDIADIAGLLKQARPDWKHILQQSGFFHNLLLGSDGHTFGLIVWLKKMEDSTARRIVVEKIEAAAKEVSEGRIELHMAGTPLMNVALDRGSRNAAQEFLPVALIVSIGFLVAAFRSWRGVLAVVAAVAVTTLWTLGLMVLLGKTLNMVTVVLPSLLFVLCLSGGIHIVCRFQSVGCAMHTTTGRSARGGDVVCGAHPTNALEDTLKETIRPVFLSNVTTSVGFGSLMISDMQPVVDFGVFAAVGMLLSVLFNFTVVPGILSMLRVARDGENRVRSDAVRRYIDMPLRQAQGRLSRAHYKRDWSPMGSAHWTASIGDAVVRRRKWSLSFAVIILIVSAGLATRAQVESNVLKFFPDSSKISRDYQFIGRRLTGFYTVELDASTESENGSTLLKAIDELSLRLADLPEVAKVINYRNLAMCLAEIPRPAFVPACTIILILIALFMKSARAMLAAVLPNLVPIFVLFALMVVLNVPFDAATVMIASVAIGIAADDTIHFLSHFRMEKRRGGNTTEIVRRTFHKVGRAITFTSVVASAGFTILALAEFKPIQYFGIFGSVTMITAWFGDVFILPACIASLRLWD